ASAGLRGHGGAAFPVAVKLRAVSSRRGRKIVLANGAEGEPASKKDRVLLRELPHLVLDGVAFAARAVDAREAEIAVPETDERSIRSLERAVAERAAAKLRGDPRLTVVLTPKRYIAGQETALINLVNADVLAPTFGTPPFRRGVRQLPTLVQNVETLAHLALIARHGSRWFRQLGTAEDPGSTLITVAGAVRAPGVYEIEHGTPLTDMLASARAEDRLAAVLVGGYFGSWVEAAQLPRLLLAREQLAPHGATLGAGVIVALGHDSCAVAETARVSDYLAGEGAGQCGPCVNGLAAIADTIQRLATGTAHAGAQRELERWCGELPGRGACAHPDGAVRFVASALRVFAAEFDDHARHGRCERCASAPVLPTPTWQPYAAAA
ncbi:MAG TPA: NADH-ubiquinone oxidoreductase-F iron-sulfur binding region domain-containing protein, partial [Solirubrobacteraceae bacterium]|nr:NADH-ubiquinone oxidoreductase-F iron-sulfur binding region domain-containing protein [Solirubrobacteraceae bacterium]